MFFKQKSEKEKSFVVGLCKLVQTTAGSEKFKELLETCVNFKNANVADNDIVLKVTGFFVFFTQTKNL